jgi:colicin import membrane protein
MLGSYLYWITTAALVLCLFMSLLRRQTVRDLAEARKKLLEEREQREAMRVELVHVRTASEKDLAAAKKQATEAKSARTELEEKHAKLEEEQTSLRRDLDEARTKLEQRTAADEVATKKIAELEERVLAGQSGARAHEDKLAALSGELETARGKTAALEKKIEGEVRLRKSAEDERNSVKATLTKVEGQQRDADRAKAALVETHAKEVQALQDELKTAKDQVVQLEGELEAERSKVQTAAPPATGGDVLSALDADPYLNRGQKETIRMTYNQFTAKRRS